MYKLSLCPCGCILKTEVINAKTIYWLIITACVHIQYCVLCTNLATLSSKLTYQMVSIQSLCRWQKHLCCPMSWHTLSSTCHWCTVPHFPDLILLCMYTCCSPLELIRADMDLTYHTAKQVITNSSPVLVIACYFYYSYLGISLLHLHSVHRNKRKRRMEYCNDSSAVETLFQCT